MLGQELRHKFVIQKVALAHTRVHKVRIKPFTQRIAKPLAHRRAKTSLATVKQIVRQNIFKRTLKNMFSARAFNLKRPRHPHRIFDEMMIQKWDTRLDAGGHCDFVNSHQKQLRQTQLQLEIGHTRQEVRIGPFAFDSFKIRGDCLK
jgi:hypothetical protein